MQELVGEVSNLMKSIALHNAMLLHQHHSHRMDTPPNSLQPLQPPAGVYKNLLVRAHTPLTHLALQE